MPTDPNALRAALRSLADQLADSLETVEAPGGSSADSALAEALRAFGDGDLAKARALAVRETPEHEALRSGIARVRSLVLSGRDAIAARDVRMDEARGAAERAADAVARQRAAVEKAHEQSRQIVQRSAELAQQMGEVAEAADHAGLLALNLGVEGLKLGGDAARTLTALGEELRKLSQRAATGARDTSVALFSMSDGARSLGGSLDDVRSAGQMASDESTKAASLSAASRRSEQALAEAADGFRALDDEAEAMLAELGSLAERVAMQAQRARARAHTPTEGREREDPAGPLLRAALERLAVATGGR